MTDPWRAKHFDAGYSGEYLPPSQHSWRILREKGKVRVFPTAAAAREAAKRRYLSIFDPLNFAERPDDPDKVAAKLAAEAESFLKSKREDVRRAETVRKAGRKPFVMVRGRA